VYRSREVERATVDYCGSRAVPHFDLLSDLRWLNIVRETMQANPKRPPGPAQSNVGDGDSGHQRLRVSISVTWLSIVSLNGPLA